MTFSQRLTHAVRPLIGAAACRWLPYLGLCAAYRQGGINKLLDFQGAVGEMNLFGLSPAPLFAALACFAGSVGGYPCRDVPGAALQGTFKHRQRIF